VLVLPGDAHVAFVAPAPADALAIRAALMKNDVLAGVRRALIGLEIGRDRYRRRSPRGLRVTYGCNAWADGQCQSKGEFLLARHGNVWRELD